MDGGRSTERRSADGDEGVDARVVTERRSGPELHEVNRPGPAPIARAGRPPTMTALGVALGSTVLAIVFAVALAMERHMHNTFPPGSH